MTVRSCSRNAEATFGWMCRWPRASRVEFTASTVPNRGRIRQAKRPAGYVILITTQSRLAKAQRGRFAIVRVAPLRHISALARHSPLAELETRDLLGHVVAREES